MAPTEGPRLRGDRWMPLPVCRADYPSVVREEELFPVLSSLTTGEWVLSSMCGEYIHQYKKYIFVLTNSLSVFR